MQARPCLFVACAPSGSRIHPPYVKLFRKHCPAESTRIVERPKNQGPEQLRKEPELFWERRNWLPVLGSGAFAPSQRPPNTVLTGSERVVKSFTNSLPLVRNSWRAISAPNF